MPDISNYRDENKLFVTAAGIVKKLRSLIPGVCIAGKIPGHLMSLVQRAVGRGDYLTISDFVRHAVREKVEREVNQYRKSRGT